MIKKFFAPFRTKVAEAEKNDNQMFFFELYFYVLLPFGIIINIDRIDYFFTTFYEIHDLPWYMIFNTFKYGIFVVLFSLEIICLLWQWVALKNFSNKFFIPLWSFFIVLCMKNIIFYIITHNQLSVLFICGIPYAIIIYYFYKRKILFVQ